MAANTDLNHPSLLQFIDKVNVKVSSDIDVSKYFSLTEDKRRGVSYLTLKLVMNSLIGKLQLKQDELLSLITILWKRNEESENYEMAAVYKNIMENFTKIYSSLKPVKRVRKIAIK
jgi:hypothetical protein